MSGQGITVAMVRGPDGGLRPTSLRRRVDLIRDAATRSWQGARGRPLREMAAAFDYARSAATAAADRGAGVVDPDVRIREATRLLWSIGDTLTRQLADLDTARREEASDGV